MSRFMYILSRSVCQVIAVFLFVTACTVPGLPGDQAGISSSTTTTTTTTTTISYSGEPVLIAIANYHFFYQEYADPRQAVEDAGLSVIVAAGF
jgi:hypothetical protein